MGSPHIPSHQSDVNHYQPESCLPFPAVYKEENGGLDHTYKGKQHTHSSYVYQNIYNKDSSSLVHCTSVLNPCL